jgi:hypothetical protein
MHTSNKPKMNNYLDSSMDPGCCLNAPLPRSINLLLQIIKSACDDCKQTLCGETHNTLLDICLGEPHILSRQLNNPLREGLRAESRRLFAVRLQSLLGSYKLLLTPTLDLFFHMIPYMEGSTSYVLELQLVHLYVTRHKMHIDICSACSQHRQYTCDYKEHPIFLGRDLMGIQDLRSHVAYMGLELGSVEHLLMDQPSAVPFKFRYFVAHLNPMDLTRCNPFDEQIQKGCHRHSVRFTHLCICSSLCNIYVQVYTKILSSGCTSDVTLEAARSVCVQGDPFVRVLSKMMAKRHTSNCDFNLRRFGVHRTRAGDQVGVICGKKKFRVSMNKRGCLSVSVVTT